MVVREVSDHFVSDDGDIHHFKRRENQRRKGIYRRAMNECCWPDSDHAGLLEVHHITLVKDGGTDDFTNYISLCSRHHRRNRLHRLGVDRLTEVLTYKFYKEKLILGFCSDEFTNDEFERKLCRHVALNTVAEKQ